MIANPSIDSFNNTEMCWKEAVMIFSLCWACPSYGLVYRFQTLPLAISVYRT
ncbi:Uncharacterised protein [Vibrio cholerae]|nr:Uncharacterised protein [Vibrio cholerae]CSI84795.1 Uncharacterised protein [Vibrio cholerae]